MHLFLYRKKRLCSYAISIIFVLITYFFIHKTLLTKANKTSGYVSGNIAKMIQKRTRIIAQHSQESFKDTKNTASVPTLLADEKETDVYVVEEHHEVLPVWFDAVSSGKILPYGNTLIHIDGHSDMGIPSFFKKYPAWRIPRTEYELEAMMQTNDVFIFGGIMTGLINRVIWVWPKWDNPKDHLMSEYKINMEVGWGIAKQRSGSLEQKVFCTCEYVQSDNYDNKQCIHLWVKEDGSMKEKEMEPDQCKIRKTFVYEEIREDKFLERFSNHTLLQENEAVMLDIDEDYHGCTYASMPLLNAGLEYARVEDIDEIVSSIICPKTSEQEKKADDILMGIIEKIKNNPYSCKQKSNYDSKCQMENKKSFLQFTERNSPYSCGIENVTRNEELANSFLKKISKLNLKQLNALQYVGFCLTTTPKTNTNFDREFGICYGANTPNDSMVFVHSPDSHEILQRSQLLRKMLKSLKKYQPKITTLCRSVRDGYTPREHFHTIEANTISALKSAFQRINLHYDIDLLGGKRGWRSKETWANSN